MQRSSKSGETSLARYDIIVKTFWGLPSCFLVWIENFSSQHQTSTTFSELVREDGSTLLLPRSPARFLTSTPKPRAEERWPPVALCRAGLGSRLGRCWALPTGEQHPSRQARLSPSAPAKNSATAFAVALFFVIERNVLATRHGCAARSACRGASACRWHARYGAGLGSRLGRCWALPTGEQHPSRQPRPSPFATFKIVRYRFCGAWLFR